MGRIFRNQIITISNISNSKGRETILMEKHLNELNSSQKEAVLHIDNPLLILAGAGSGKTKTLTTRLAYLISLGIDPSNTLTLTFTNKAAKEMRDRALNMIESPLYPPLLCTFHKFGLLFLKFHIQALNRRNNFVLIDSDDKKKILKELDGQSTVSILDNEISKLKNSSISPTDAISSAEYTNQKRVALIYKKYEEYLLDKNLVDFDDLLVLPYKILNENSEILEESSRRYRYIMIDEYQDTNEIQYKIIQKLCSTHQNICVVGDDDQSIYGWRGANIGNILNFQQNFKNSKKVKLEINYRSTNQILKISNSLISHNRNRHSKQLESFRGDGKEVEVFESKNEQEEAFKISKEIKRLKERGVSLDNIAILFRLNALSRSIEDGLSRAAIPYKLVGAMKFYERSEIKDLLCFLRLILNPNDDFALKRVINKPKRGIGKATFQKLELASYSQQKSIYTIMKEDSDIKDKIGVKNYKTICEYFEKIDELSAIKDESSIELIDSFEKLLGYKQSYQNSPDSIEKISNIEEFYGMYRDFVISNPLNGLEDFLNELSLSSDKEMENDSRVSCMSIHSSKGLEFDYVFVVGLEEGFFPLVRDMCDIEEERRLGYVAFTRARDELYLSYVTSRNYKGRRSELQKSRFLREAGLVKGVLKLEKGSSFKVGDFVDHKIFGQGRVLGVSSVGKEYKLKINFGGEHREILSPFVKKIS